jgi:uncharacterized membrane protein (UPF0136 family)
MSKSVLILALYGLLILAGGVMGHSKAASMASLVMGVTFGLALLACSFALYKKKRASIWIAVSLIIVLDAFFTYRYAHTQRFMPSGLLSLVSLATLFAFILQVRKQKLFS